MTRIAGLGARAAAEVARLAHHRCDPLPPHPVPLPTCIGYVLLSPRGPGPGILAVHRELWVLPVQDLAEAALFAGNAVRP
jgi:hypothetical protein